MNRNHLFWAETYLNRKWLTTNSRDLVQLNVYLSIDIKVIHTVGRQIVFRPRDPLDDRFSSKICHGLARLMLQEPAWKQQRVMCQKLLANKMFMHFFCWRTKSEVISDYRSKEVKSFDRLNMDRQIVGMVLHKQRWRKCNEKGENIIQ